MFVMIPYYVNWKKYNNVVNYAAAIVVKNVQAKSSLLDPIQTPKAKECLVNFDTQTLHIGQ